MKRVKKNGEEKQSDKFIWDNKTLVCIRTEQQDVLIRI